MKPGHIHVPSDCEKVSGILQRIGDKWAVLIIILLGNGSLRFSELRKQISNISQRMLTFTLRGLERDGLVTRTVTPTVPPRVDYALTPLGTSLLEPLQTLGTWAKQNVDDIARAQTRYDKLNPEK
ncbi:MAG: helix-turn-helix transcriptional regulator [Blastochloris viridis]|uniref:Helix-turn-helix transcriptional regulator n=1 Tax=Blastochloris viridis TaxID=1079 RepID=A0A6N4R8D3_BLAVI|nr:MAG: helix-turn-helix transcriptional regulator [Blastochloris viridis]